MKKRQVLHQSIYSAALDRASFYKTWDAFWFKTIPADATFQSFQVAGDSSPGIHTAGDLWRVTQDINYQILTSNSDPVRTIYEPGAWDNRDSGTNPIGSTHIPDSFTLADASPGDTPNNPTTILNRDSGVAVYLNACARPSSGGSVWGYIATISSVPIASTHGGAYLAGGEVTLRELETVIPHAIAINIWAAKYLSNTGGGFVAPARHADTGYDDPFSGNYYGGNITTIKMGSRFGIPAGVSAGSLGVSSVHGLALYTAFRTYGAYVVDNTGWDAIAINCTPDANSALSAIQSEIAAIFGALQLVL